MYAGLPSIYLDRYPGRRGRSWLLGDRDDDREGDMHPAAAAAATTASAAAAQRGTPSKGNNQDQDQDQDRDDDPGAKKDVDEETETEPGNSIQQQLEPYAVAIAAARVRRLYARVVLRPAPPLSSSLSLPETETEIETERAAVAAAAATARVGAQQMLDTITAETGTKGASSSPWSDWLRPLAGLLNAKNCVEDEENDDAQAHGYVKDGLEQQDKGKVGDTDNNRSSDKSSSGRTSGDRDVDASPGVQDPAVSSFSASSSCQEEQGLPPFEAFADFLQRHAEYVSLFCRVDATITITTTTTTTTTMTTTSSFSSSAAAVTADLAQSTPEREWLNKQLAQAKDQKSNPEKHKPGVGTVNTNNSLVSFPPPIRDLGLDPDPDEREWDLTDPVEQKSFEDEAAEMWTLARERGEAAVRENWFGYGMKGRVVYTMLRKFERGWRVERGKREMEEVD
ncbi:hypothetical protein VTJ04DRAFT_2844 [Mycothermus thermophilus]|uniref:uncharacterized protein n=1 Tax=Humicola insolens TaxID=85995 RepID=UPI003743D408